MASGNICVIGPRSSGKTTYLAALAYHQKHGQGSKRFQVNPQNPESKELAEKAENILLDGLDFEPTVIGQEIQSVDDLPFYSFGIEAKTAWHKSPQQFQLTVRDYPGEVFHKLADPKLADNIHREFINECFTDVMGCLIMLTAWEQGTDSFYKRVLEQFIQLMDEHNRSGDLKLAIVMSKCERGEIWPGRLEPEIDLFGVHLPKTREVLRQRISKKNLNFFALSTFGVLGRIDPRPNREDRLVQGEPSSVLRNRDPKKWRPYNLIEPLYWLSQTSQRKSM